MHVVEHEPHGVVPDRLHLEDHHLALAGDGLAFIRVMALHLRARALDAQILGGQREGAAALERDRERAPVLGEPDFRGPGALILRAFRTWCQA